MVIPLYHLGPTLPAIEIKKHISPNLVNTLVYCLIFALRCFYGYQCIPETQHTPEVPLQGWLKIVSTQL